MKLKLNPPSLQHVARIYRDTPLGVKNELLKLVRSRPPFSYEDIYDLIWEMVRFKRSYEDIRLAVASRIKLQIKRENFLRVLPAIEKFFRHLEPTYALKIEPRFYSVGRNMRVPFSPPMVCGTKNGPILPWLIFWKKNPMTKVQTSLLVTMVDEILEQDSDLEQTRLLIVDMSLKGIGSDGTPTVIETNSIPRLANSDKKSMLATIAEGFALAQIELAGLPEKEKFKRKEMGAANQSKDQMDIFDRSEWALE